MNIKITFLLATLFLLGGCTQLNQVRIESDFYSSENQVIVEGFKPDMSNRASYRYPVIRTISQYEEEYRIAAESEYENSSDLAKIRSGSLYFVKDDTKTLDILQSEEELRLVEKWTPALPQDFVSSIKASLHNRINYIISKEDRIIGLEKMLKGLPKPTYTKSHSMGELGLNDSVKILSGGYSHSKEGPNLGWLTQTNYLELGNYLGGEKKTDTNIIVDSKLVIEYLDVEPLWFMVNEKGDTYTFTSDIPIQANNSDEWLVYSFTHSNVTKTHYGSDKNRLLEFITNSKTIAVSLAKDTYSPSFAKFTLLIAPEITYNYEELNALQSFDSKWNRLVGKKEIMRKYGVTQINGRHDLVTLSNKLLEGKVQKGYCFGYSLSSSHSDELITQALPDKAIVSIGYDKPTITFMKGDLFNGQDVQTLGRTFCYNGVDYYTNVIGATQQTLLLLAVK